MTATKRKVANIESPRMRAELMNLWTASTSAVALDMRSPVCCLSWKPKLRFWSLVKMSLRMS